MLLVVETRKAGARSLEIPYKGLCWGTPSLDTRSINSFAIIEDTGV